MANLKISQLTPGSLAQISDLLPAARSGTNVSLNVGNIREAVQAYYDVRDYGAALNGVTDDTAALNAAILAAFNAGGGTVLVPGQALILGQVTLPNDGVPHGVLGVYNQHPIRITGLGSGSYNGQWASVPSGFSTLDMRYNAPVAKILTIGSGTLEIDHLNIIDGGSDSAPFIKTINTTLKIHDCAFQGTASGFSAVNDAIILGGQTNAYGNGTDYRFQGYGTVIRDNFFSKIRRAVVGGLSANGCVISCNTISANCGNSTGSPPTTGNAAIEFVGDSDQCTGNYISGNLFELVFYTYGISFEGYCAQNFISGNSYFDNGVSTSGGVYYGANSAYNSQFDAYIPGSIPFGVDANGTNLILSSGGNGLTSFVYEPWSFNTLYMEKGAVNPSGPTYLAANGNQWAIATSTSGSVLGLTYTPSGGSLSYIAAFDNGGLAGIGRMILITSGGNSAYIDSGGLGGTSPLNIRAATSVTITPKVSTPQIVGLTSPITPNAVGGTTLGSAALPWGSVYIGAAATNNIQITGTATAARVFTLPDAASNPVQPLVSGTTHKWVSYIDSTGTQNLTQPAASDLSNGTTGSSGGVVLANAPTLTGTVTASVLFGGTGTNGWGINYINSGLQMAVNGRLTWGASLTPDTGITRTSGATVAIGNGAAGDASGTITAATVNATSSYQANGTSGANAVSGVYTTFTVSEGIVTAISNPSDESLKTDIRNLELGLDTVVSLNPKRFKWNEAGQKFTGLDGAKENVGFTAQDVMKVIPEAVWEQDGYLALDDRPIIAALVNAVKELCCRVKELEAGK